VSLLKEEKEQNNAQSVAKKKKTLLTTKKEFDSFKAQKLYNNNQALCHQVWLNMDQTTL
jgi:hypothetical protein